MLSVIYRIIDIAEQLWSIDADQFMFIFFDTHVAKQRGTKSQLINPFGTERHLNKVGSMSKVCRNIYMSS